MTAYSYSKQLNLPFEEVVTKTITSLKEEGFGILTDIDVKKTLKEKLDVDFSSYRILGACNPPLAYQALQAEQAVGLLMPCNVIVYENEGKTFVAAILPTVAMAMIDNPLLAKIAAQAEVKLKQALDRLNS